jgi:hypothetical protein
MGLGGAIVMALAGSVSGPLALLAAHLNSAHPRGLLVVAVIAGGCAVLAVLLLRTIRFSYRAAGPTVMVSFALLMNGNDLTNSVGSLLAAAIWVGVSLLLLFTITRSPDRAVYRSLNWAMCAFFLSWPVTSADRGSPTPPSEMVWEARANAAANRDVILIVLDGFASPSVIAASLGEDLPFFATLEEMGFSVPALAWAPSTKTELSVGSYLEQDLLRVPNKNVLRGDGSLFNRGIARSHRISYVESGWYGTVCGASVDICYRRHLIDDSVQAAIDLSLFNRWSYAEWGHAFGYNGVRAMRDARTAIEDIQANADDDFLFAHVLLPHEPYLFDAACERASIPAGLPDGDPLAKGQERMAYLEQVKCLGTLLVDLAGAIKSESIVVFAGDHGTAFRRQMDKPAVEWTELDVLERGSTFLAYRMLSGCETPSGNSTMEAISVAIACGTGLRLPPSPPELWLSPYGGSGVCLDPRTLGVSNAC